MAKSIFFGLAFFGALATLAYLSLFRLSFETPDLSFDGVDKLGHAMAYFITMILGCLFLKERSKKALLKRSQILVLGLLLCVYGMIIEVLQHILPVDRWAEIWDVVANGVGIYSGGRAFQMIFNRSPVKKA